MKRRDFLSTSLGLAVASALAPAQQAQASSHSSTNFDVAIVGAGLFGSAAARHLSKVSDGVALIGPKEPQQKSTHKGVFASHYDTSRLTRVIDPNLVWGTLRVGGGGLDRFIATSTLLRGSSNVNPNVTAPRRRQTRAGGGESSLLHLSVIYGEYALRSGRESRSQRSIHAHAWAK